MLDRNYSYHILCEDKQTQCYLMYFLLRHKIERRKISCFSLPAGNGCGEQFVREHYPAELTKLRSRNFNKNCLVVAIDTDKAETTVEYRKNQLDSSCIENNVPVRGQSDCAMIFVPKRNIETWIEFYSGNQNVDELTKYPHHYGNESDCKSLAEIMADDFIRNNVATNVLPSILAAKTEYDRVCALQ